MPDFPVAKKNTIIINQRITDFELFLHSMKNWDLEFCKLDNSPFQTHIKRIISPTIDLFNVQFNCKLDQHGSPPSTLRTVAIPADDYQHFFWRGKELTGNKIGIWPLGGELEAVSKKGFHAYGLSFPDDYLIETCGKLGFPTLNDMLKDQETLELSRLSMIRLRKYLAFYLHKFLTQPSLLSNELILKNAEFKLVRTFLTSLKFSHIDSTYPSLRSRDQALKRALGFIKINAYRAPRIKELYHEACTSERTLQYAFLEHFGVSPKHYLESYRLNGVRKDLHLADPSSTRIKDVADRWGFWHMGKFSMDYHKHFGERPSETLRKRYTLDARRET
jgi:AraC family ethanolamine operon transcriptional activator